MLFILHHNDVKMSSHDSLLLYTGEVLVTPETCDLIRTLLETCDLIRVLLETCDLIRVLLETFDRANDFPFKKNAFSVSNLVNSVSAHFVHPEVD